MNEQTIDGVPRELLERITAGPSQVDYIKAWRELRALLDAPALERKPFGWFRTPKDCPLQGMFLHYDPERGERDIQNASDSGFTVKRLFDSPVTPPQGDPVAELQVAFFEHGPMATINWFMPSAFEPGLTKLYAAQPAPVATEPQRIDYSSLDAVQRLAVCRGEL